MLCAELKRRWVRLCQKTNVEPVWSMTALNDLTLQKNPKQDTACSFAWLLGCLQGLANFLLRSRLTFILEEGID